MAATEEKYQLGYWDIRGLAATIRMALHYAGVFFEELSYTSLRTEGKWMSTWARSYKEMQVTNKHPFPNLPYLTLPDGTVLVHSGAILRHLGRKFKLYGETEAERCRCDEVLEQLKDFRTEFQRLCYGAGDQFFNKAQDFAEQVIPYYFQSLERYLERNSNCGKGSATEEEEASGSDEWVCGSSVTVADFELFDMFDVAMEFAQWTDTSTVYPRIHSVMERVRALPELQQYFAGPALTLPRNNKMAAWGAGARDVPFSSTSA